MSSSALWCASHYTCGTRLTDFIDEVEMLEMKSKNQNFKFNELNRRI